MPDEKITRDELLMLLRDTYLKLNALSTTLRDVFIENLDDIITIYTHQQTTTQNPPSQ